MARKKTVQSTPKLFYTILFLLFPMVASFTPNLNTLDSNGSKFLGLAILNVLVFLILNKKNSSYSQFGYGYFKRIGITYLLFVIVGFLSFFKAVNIEESYVMMAKIVTIFTSSILIYRILSIENSGVSVLVRAASILLVFESVYIFYEVGQYINGDIESLNDIKAIYSNKNVLASAIFIKTTIAMWLFTFGKGKWRNLGLLAVTFGTLSTLFLSTRSFYIGSLLILILFLVLLFQQYRISKDKIWVRKSIQYGSMFVTVIGIFSVTQYFFYPNETNTYNTTLIERLESISDFSLPDNSDNIRVPKPTETVVNTTKKDQSLENDLTFQKVKPIAKKNSINSRLASWSQSVELVKNEPILGVGIGNWKVRSLEFDNKTSDDFIYQTKNHNDFLEMFAEVGIIGGTLYLFIFLIAGWVLIVAGKRENNLKVVFLPAFGLLSYFIDSVFNFPIDRPEIGVFFSLFIALTIQDEKPISSKINMDGILIWINSKWIKLTLGTVALLGVVYVLFLNFDSLKEQRIVLEDLNTGRYTQSSSSLEKKYPDIPSITLYGEPIAVNKARYLIEEKKYKKAIEILKVDNSSPFDSRKEFFLCLAYQGLGMQDSALFYINKALVIKPYFYNSVELKCNLLNPDKNEDEIIGLLTKYIEGYRKNKSAWIRLAFAYEKTDIPKAIKVLSTGLTYLPYREKKELVDYRNILVKRNKIAPQLELYTEAKRLFENKDYANAEKLLSEFIRHEKGVMESFELRAFCYFSIQEYQLCLDDCNYIEKHGKLTSSNLNLRGSAYHYLGDDYKACIDFSASANEGNQNALTNYNAFCK